MYAYEYRTVLDKETKLSLLQAKRFIIDKNKSMITSPRDIYDFFENRYMLSNMTEENVFLLCCNTKYVIGVFHISSGTVNYSIVNTREVIRNALLADSVNIILVHSHPSGDATPSNEDMVLTNRLKESSKLIGINFLDHVIIGDGYYSFKENNNM